MKTHYFRFYPDCHYVKGPVRGAIYCLTEHKLIHLSQEETAIVNQWLENNTVGSVEQRYGENAKNLLYRLVREGIGATFPVPVYTEEYEPSTAHKKLELMEDPPRIKMAFVQVTDKCESACSFCGDPEYMISNGCTSCLRWKQKEELCLKKTDKKILLNQLLQLEPAALTISGGNPLLEWDSVLEIVVPALEKRPSLHVVVHTNGSGFTEQVEQDALTLNIEFVFTVLANSREGYERITGSADQFENLLHAVERCKINRLKYSFCILVFSDSWSEYDLIRQFVDGLNGLFVNNCEVVKRESKDKSLASLPFGVEEGEKHFAYLNSRAYFHARHFNRCLDGRLALSTDGTILPCPHWEDPIGRFPDLDVYGCFRERMQRKFWRKTKEEIPTCSKCEFRLACADCSLTEQYRMEDPAVHPVFCTYQPGTGKWIKKPAEQNGENEEVRSAASG